MELRAAPTVMAAGVAQVIVGVTGLVVLPPPEFEPPQPVRQSPATNDNVPSAFLRNKCHLGDCIFACVLMMKLGEEPRARLMDPIGCAQS